MKSVGEVMAIGRTFEESLQKAIRQVDPRWKGFEAYIQPEDIDRALSRPTDMRLFAIAYAMFNKQYDVDKIHELTKIDKVCSDSNKCQAHTNGAHSLVVPVQDRQHRPDGLRSQANWFAR